MSRTIQQYISEQLSKSNMDRLKDLVDSGIVNDDNFEDIYKEVLKISKVSGIDRTTFNSFFDKHGLNDLRWGRNNDAFTEMVRLFAKNSNVDKLKEIVTKDGAISVYEMPFSGNVFDTPRKQGWEDEAKTLALMTNSRSANAGPCELLLKFMLREGNGRIVGDVGIDQDEMEVKAITRSEKGGQAAGGHAAGQKGGIQMTYSIYYIINALAFGEDDMQKAKKELYFQKKKGFEELNQKIKDSGIEMSKFIEIVLDAILYQYNFKTFSGGKLSDTSELSKLDIRTLKSSFIDYTSKCISGGQISDMKEFINAIGAVQLYLYSVIEGFDYLFLVYIDKGEKDPNSGKYVMFRDIASGKTNLSDISIVLEYLTFGNLDSAITIQGRTGKMNFRNI